MPRPKVASSDPQILLEQGAAILYPLLSAHGFVFEPVSVGSGSGGRFAAGRFVRSNRRLDLGYRYSLGPVSYSVGLVSLEHSDYVRAVSGGRGSYPGFPSEPLEGFRHLLADLERYGRTFLNGSEAAFALLAGGEAVSHSSAAADS